MCESIESNGAWHWGTPKAWVRARNVNCIGTWVSPLEEEQAHSLLQICVWRFWASSCLGLCWEWCIRGNLMTAAKTCSVLFPSPNSIVTELSLLQSVLQIIERIKCQAMKSSNYSRLNEAWRSKAWHRIAERAFVSTSPSMIGKSGWKPRHCRISGIYFIRIGWHSGEDAPPLKSQGGRGQKKTSAGAVSISTLALGLFCWWLAHHG